MKILFIIFLVLPGALVKGQSQRLDSMLKVLSAEKDDSDKVKTLSRISQYYYSVDPLKSFPYANQAMQLAEQIKWKKGISNMHNNLGLYIADTGNNILAREHYQLSYKLNLELGAKTNQVNNLNNIGRSYQVDGDFGKATDNFFRALTIAEELKDNNLISLVGTNITGCFITQKNFSKAAEYAEMTLKAAVSVNNAPNIILSQMQISTILGVQKDTVAAIQHLQAALQKAKETNNRVQEANVLVNLANKYAPDHKKQVQVMLQVNEIMDEINPTSMTSLVNNANLGDVYTELAREGKPSEKAAYIEKATASLLRAKDLAEQNHSVEYLSSIDHMLVGLEEEKGNYKMALAYYKKFIATNDSLFSQEKKNEIAGLEGQHNMAVKDKEIAINRLMLSNQRKTQWGLIAGLLLFGLIGALLFRQSRIRKKTNTTLMVLNNQLDEANKVKARFFGILSHDLRSPIVNLVHFLHLQKDSPDLLNEEQQARYRQNISQSAEGLLNTMETMLQWSKQQMEQFTPSIKMIAVDDLFAHLQSFFSQTENVNIQFNYAPGLLIPADENYLLTIMQNLTANAIRALKNTPQASIVWAAKMEAKTIVLSITDNGPGIEAAQAKVLFDDSTVTNSKNGFGLHLVRDLAKAIQYKIAVQSEQGKGSVFTLSNVVV